MAPPTAFDKVTADRAAIRDHLELLEYELKAHKITPLGRTQAEGYCQEASELKRQLVDNQKTIRLHAPTSADMDTLIQEFKTLSTQASRLHCGLHGIVASFPTTAKTTTGAASSSSVTQHIKLPPLELQKFSGNLQEWVSFRDLYVTAVHNSSLSKVEKLTQLKSLLTGEAARQVRSLILSEANYDIAWQALKDRYENNRELLFSIMKRLFSQPSISTGSATGLRSLIDTTKECVRSLEVLSIPTQHWDAVLLYTLFSKLDATSRELWEQSLPDTNVPALSKLFDFMEHRARALAASTMSNQRSTYQPPPQRSTTKQVQNHHLSTKPCRLSCQEQHPLFRCPVFFHQTTSQRLDTVKKFKLCENCLSDSHAVSACKSVHRCKMCNKRHHSMVHVMERPSSTGGGRQNQQQQQAEGSVPATGTTSNHHTTQAGTLQTGVLATARITIREQAFRSLVDGGSTNTYITERAARNLNLSLHSVHVTMTGLSASSAGTARYVTTFQFSPHFQSNLKLEVTALVVRSISTNIPANRLERNAWTHLNNLQLADPNFDEPGAIDVLLGTDIVWSIMDGGRLDGETGTPFAINTSLGWMVAGPNVTSTPVTTFSIHVNLEQQLCRFWEQEEVFQEDKLTTEEEACEEHFLKHHTQRPDGRFQVHLPFKTDSSIKLGATRAMAIQRFIGLENKFVHHRNVRDPEKIRSLENHWKQYKDFMDEYELLGHMSRIPINEQETSSPHYYIPHHSVLKESSTTTKLRVVFDASAKSTTGFSLNDCLMVGPQLQDSITGIMLRFRTYQIAFTADIEKMYRQIMVTPEHRDFQRIIWRPSPTVPIQEYRLNTVTYGTSTAPYLAVKCLQQLAETKRHMYPDAARVALRDCYMDDATSGSNTLEDAKRTVHQLIQLCKEGGFQLRKWTTSNQTLLETIPEELRETKTLIEMQSEDTTIKTLGTYWNPSKDEYSFTLTLPPIQPGKYSKRLILSEIARIFDPLGWLSPAIIVCKIFMQELWRVKSTWDEVLDTVIQEKWMEIRSSLQAIESIKIPRCVVSSPNTEMMLVGCCDASLKAISAVVYLVCLENQHAVSCNLLTSKTRVAPLKHVTLPRLELNGAVLLAELYSSVFKSLNLPISQVWCFTDSTITQHWIKSPATKWKPFIRRRVQAIQDSRPAANWYHIPGINNPADCASRGITAEELRTHSMWWNGVSEFITLPQQQSPELIEEDLNLLQSEVLVKVHFAQPNPLNSIFLKYSNFNRLVRIVAYLIRFIINWVRKQRNRTLNTTPLSPSELHKSRFLILRQLQRNTFPNEYCLLLNGKQLPSSSKLLSLQPFLCKDGLIRVGGRLRHAKIPFQLKHQILLPHSHQLTALIIWNIHYKYFHLGPGSTLNCLQQEYWIINGRDAVRYTLKKCIVCTRHHAKFMEQSMADLPFHRVNPSPPFSKVGVDYAGPIAFRPMVRSKVTLKGWLAVFVCLATRAIHIEVVSTLSTTGFLAALWRFTRRRSVPSDIFSDQGTNFKGADNALKEFYNKSNQTIIQGVCASSQINWHFNPAGAPHMGGLWEAGVKSIKHHLHRVSGSPLLTYEELNTLVIQIEGILNSRPLVPRSSDPNDLNALTPGHFLIGRPLTELPEPNLVDEKLTCSQRWELIQQRQQVFWMRWSSEFITRLQQRPKWMKPKPNLEVGQLVIIKDERMPPLKWKLGRVLAVHPGSDGLVRVATLKTEGGELKRPIVKLALLPIEPSNTDNELSS